MQVNHRPTKILILGKSGSGKTTYFLRFVENADYTTVFLFDHKLEFLHRLGLNPSYSREDLLERLKAGEKFISYHHSEEFPGDAEAGFRFFCEWSFAMGKILGIDGRKRLVGIDEVNRFTGTSDMGWEFGQLIEDGRLQGLDFIGTSHAANQIHNRLRLQLTEIVALRTSEDRPLQFLESNGFDPDEIRSLPVGSFVVKDCEIDEFSRGKLFSCPNPPKRVDAEETEELESSTIPERSTQNAIPDSPAD